MKPQAPILHQIKSANKQPEEFVEIKLPGMKPKGEPITIDQAADKMKVELQRLQMQHQINAQQSQMANQLGNVGFNEAQALHPSFPMGMAAGASNMASASASAGNVLQAPIKPMVLGERPVVQKITAEVRMSRLTAEQIFPNLIFGENEDHVILTEVLVPSKPGQPIALVHGASGQKFMVDHYELDGVRL